MVLTYVLSFANNMAATVGKSRYSARKDQVDDDSRDSMKRIKDLFPNHQRTFSIEYFPPKTEKGLQNLWRTMQRLAALKPTFMTCTYGAGGGTRDKTLDIVQHIQEEHKLVGVAHLTTVLHTREELKDILDDARRRGIRNILALRGDPPKDQPDWKPGRENLKYSSELVSLIRDHSGDHFGIAVAGFPEGHIHCPDRDQDAQYLKLKIDAGADFVITQLFFDNDDYFSYVQRLRKIGVDVRVVPGILPITDYQKLLRFTQLCGANVPEKVKNIFEPIQDDEEKVREEGIQFAIRQCQELLKGGAPGLHMYCLNKAQPTEVILKEVRSTFP